MQTPEETREVWKDLFARLKRKTLEFKKLFLNMCTLLDKKQHHTKMLRMLYCCHDTGPMVAHHFFSRKSYDQYMTNNPIREVHTHIEK